MASGVYPQVPHRRLVFSVMFMDITQTYIPMCSVEAVEADDELARFLSSFSTIVNSTGC